MIAPCLADDPSKMTRTKDNGGLNIDVHIEGPEIGNEVA